MLKALSKSNNQTIGELIRHAVTKTFKPKAQTQSQILKKLQLLGKKAKVKGINYKELVNDGRKY
jgi:hypothetical protein